MAGERSWMVDIQNSVNGLNPETEAELWGKQSIYRVPWFLKELKPEAYRPAMVSFGPYHHGDRRLKPMEEHKERALLHFLKRTEKPLDDFVSGMAEIVQQLRGSYQNLDDEWKDTDRFLKMMIVDGCFMLELMKAHVGLVKDYSDIDPIFGKRGMLPHIWRDMLMVENQLPLLVLYKLVAVQSGNIVNEGQINHLVLLFVAAKRHPTDDVGQAFHLLDLYYKSLIQLPKSSRSPSPSFRITQSPLEEALIPPADSDGNRESPVIIRWLLELLVKVGLWKRQEGQIIRSALELDEAGIQFQVSKTKSLHDIKFDGNVLSLPVIEVHDSTEFVFRNLIAFEQLHVGTRDKKHVTSYVSFMDHIIDSAKDVTILRSKGIIRNNVGSDQAAANIFNALTKEVVGYKTEELEEVNRNLDIYCEKKWKKWRANLIRTYFRSPWSFLSLAAAIILLLLTVVTAVYTILSYYNS